MSTLIPEPLPNALPEEFGRYILVRKLGTHGLVEIYLAIQRSLAGTEKLVVIKRLHNKASRFPTLVDALLREGRIAGQLSHPNIIQGFDVGEHAGSYFLAMEYVSGQSLRSILERLASASIAKMPLEHALGVVISACAALGYAHDKLDIGGDALGLVHGALYPESVLVSYAGEIKLTDFGAVSVREPDPRSDLCGLGAILFELTTGRPLVLPPAPFEAGKTISDSHFPRPRQIDPSYPAALEAIVMKATARLREQRYQRAADMQVALEDFARKSGIAVSRASLAAWMDQVFRDRGRGRELREARQIAEKAGLLAPDSERRPAPLSELEVTFSPLPGDASPAASEPPPAIQTLAPPPGATVRYGRRAAIAVTVVALGALAIRASAPAQVADGTSRAKSLGPGASRQGNATPAENVGQIHLVSEPPGCAVWIEGDLQGATTPTVLERLPLGRPVHIRLTREGFAAYTTDVELDASHPARSLTAQLDPAKFTLLVQVDALHPAIWVDGKYQETAKIEGLSVGEDHKIAVSAQGRVGKVVYVRAEQAGERELEFKLEPIRWIK
jgi:serine/threonine-protein kinase